mgnify:CR=1 FL=1
MIVEISDNEADGIANSLVMNTDFMRKIKNSIALDSDKIKQSLKRNENQSLNIMRGWRDKLLSELNEHIDSTVRALIIEELPNALDMLFVEEEK